jgi:hypothetical protein
MVAKSLRRVIGAGHVGLAGIIGDIASLLDKLVGARVVSSIATSCHLVSAVENKLNGKVDVIALAFARNLDAVAQGAERTMSPATSTVLGNVLVETVSQIRDAVDIGPRERVGEVLTSNVGVGQGGLDVVVNCVIADLQYQDGKGIKLDYERSIIRHSEHWSLSRIRRCEFLFIP